jgi:pyridoxal 5'-phosphate synthase pdxS subunit
VLAVTHWEDAGKLAEISTGLGKAMPGRELGTLAASERFAGRGG